MSTAVTPEELWSRVQVARGADVRLAQEQLESWLLGEQLAVRVEGGLAPTVRTLALGDAIAEVEHDTGGRRRR